MVHCIAVTMTAQSISNPSTICLLAHPSPSFHNLSVPHPPQVVALEPPLYTLPLSVPSLPPSPLHPQSPFLHHHHLLLLLLLLMQHYLHPAPLQAGWPPLLLTPSICLIMTLSQSIRLILFLCQWQILIQTMSLLWIYDLSYLPHLFMVNPWGDSQGDNQGTT